MKRFVSIFALLLLIFALALAGCGKGGGTTTTNQGGGNTVGLEATNFSQHSLTVTAGMPVHFDNTVNGGGFHILCVGTGNGGEGPSSCAKSGDGPTELYGDGLTMSGGQTKDLTFPKAGTYHIICTVHPGMVIDVTVQ
jgi:plastocyanin